LKEMDTEPQREVARLEAALATLEIKEAKTIALLDDEKTSTECHRAD
jgi:hypothetical protein